MERVKRVGRYLVGKPRAVCLFRWQQRGELEAYSDADWGGDNSTRRSVSVGVIMRGEHCFKVSTKKQQVVSLSTAESELYAAVKTAFHPQRAGQSETRQHAELVDKRGLQVRRVSSRRKWVRTWNLMTKPLPRPKIEQLMKLMGYRFAEQYLERAEFYRTRLVSSQQRAE